MTDPTFTDAQLQAAIEALQEPARFHEAERRVAGVAPQLQDVLVNALADGGWFDQTQQDQLAKIAAIDDLEQRFSAFRTLLAEEARLGMMVGVAVGWELARELEIDQSG